MYHTLFECKQAIRSVKRAQLQELMSAHKVYVFLFEYNKYNNYSFIHLCVTASWNSEDCLAKSGLMDK